MDAILGAQKSLATINRYRIWREYVVVQSMVQPAKRLEIVQTTNCLMKMQPFNAPKMIEGFVQKMNCCMVFVVNQEEIATVMKHGHLHLNQSTACGVRGKHGLHVVKVVPEEYKYEQKLLASMKKMVA